MNRYVKAFDDAALSRAQVFPWHKDYIKRGRESVEDEPRGGTEGPEARAGQHFQCVRPISHRDLTVRMMNLI